MKLEWKEGKKEGLLPATDGSRNDARDLPHYLAEESRKIGKNVLSNLLQVKMVKKIYF